MNPEICDRCRLKYSLLKCENCQESFCSECDSFIHSITSKKQHIRTMIYSQPTYETISKLNLNFEPNKESKSKLSIMYPKTKNNISHPSSSLNRLNEEQYNLAYDINNINNLSLNEENYFNNEDNSQSIPEKLIFESYRDRNQNLEEINNMNEISQNNKLNKNMSGFYIGEIKNIYQCEKNELIFKINELSKELVDAKTNLGEHIDYLNNHIIQLENKYKDQIAELTLKNSNDLKTNSVQKDTRILELESELNIEKEKNAALQKKLEEYEKTLKNNQNDIAKLSDEKLYIDKAKKTSEDRLKSKISEIEKNHSDEMNKMKNNYESEINKIKSELDASKMDYLKINENSKENMNKMITERNKEKSFYENIITKLKEDIDNKNIENEQLLNLTKNLQKNNENLSERIGEMNKEIANKDMEQKSMRKTMNKMQKEKNNFEKENLKYQSVLYGRFKKKGKNKEY